MTQPHLITVNKTYSRADTLKAGKASLTDASCDVLVIGAGLAGLTTALSLPNTLQITLLAKEGLQDCSSHYAQGGIAAVIDKEDSVNEHVQDTLIAGDGLCDPIATTEILAQGANAIQWLLQHEVPFTTNRGSTTAERLAECRFFAATPTHTTTQTSIKNKVQTSVKNKSQTANINRVDALVCADLHLTQEGGHGRRRVVHADDATGKHIMTALHQRVAAAANITLLPFHEAVSLLTTPDTCQGATVYHSKTDSVFEITAKAVVLASGGLGQLFSRATAPNVCVGDGIMMAYDAGCRLANLEFVQFHPTGLVYSDANGTSNFLISEAVRGEGGYLLCPSTGERFMPQYDAREELAPRDIVARAIANEITKNGLGYVHLDISHQPADFIKTHFPDIYAHCLALGMDITKAPIPVAPTAHYTCGGVMTTATGQTDVKGLYAAGEVAHTGLHGANRLASNSLLECVVVGREIAQHIPTYLAATLANNESWIDSKSLTLPHAVLSVPDLRSSNLHKSEAQNLKPSSVTRSVVPLLPSSKELDKSNPLTHLKQLKQLMTDHMGIRRHHDDLAVALKQVLIWQQASQSIGNLSHSVSPSHSETAATMALLQWQRLLRLAVLLLQSALTRVESRGGHYRNDYPELDKNPKISVVYPAQWTYVASPTLNQLPDYKDKTPPNLNKRHSDASVHKTTPNDSQGTLLPTTDACREKAC